MLFLITTLGDVLDYLKEAVENGLRTLCAVLCQYIYPLIAAVYDVFINIATLKGLLDTSVIHDIYQRVTLILTVIMTFYITFEFIKYVIEPDNMSDKEKGVGKLIYRIIGVVVLIAFVPKIFSLAYDFQNTIVQNDAISKIILGKKSVDSSDYGKRFSAQMFSMFYYIEQENLSDNTFMTCENLPCEQLVQANISSLANNGNLPYLKMGINEKHTITSNIGEVKTTKIHFDGFWAVIVGLLILWMLILYCIDLGTRAVQLIYLQIIAPIPIIGFLSPKKDGIFQKWCKQCLTTYLDIFLRLSILNFILLICDSILSSNTFENFQSNGLFVKISLILGLLLFAKRLPELLKELFPKGSVASGSFGLKGAERVAPLAARTIAAGLGGTSRLLGGGVSRAINTHRRNRDAEERTGKSTKERAQDAKLASKNRKDAIKNYNQAKRAYRSGRMTKEQFDVAKNNKKDAESKFAEAQSNKQKSVIGNALAGAVGGAARGAKTGWGATKAEEIFKKGLKEAANVDRTAISEREQWLDAGGYSNTSRNISKIEQKMGIMTEAQRMERESKSYEAEAKALENVSQGEQAIVQSADKVKDNDIKKLKEGKINFTSGKNQTLNFGLDEKGNPITFEINANEGLSNAYIRANTETLTAEQKLKAAIDRNASQEEIDTAQKELNRKKVQEEQVGKKLHEIAMDQYLRAIADYEKDQNNPNPRTNSNFDQGSIQSTYETIWNIENARKNSATVNDMRRILVEPISDSDSEEIKRKKESNLELFYAFMGQDDRGNKVYIDKFSIYDGIEKALKRATGERNQKIYQDKQYQQRINSSDAYAAAKANDSSTKPGK